MEDTENATQEYPPQQDKRPTQHRAFLYNLAVLLLAPLIAILLTFFVFQSYQVSGMSMQNTLQNNDRLIVWKGSRTWSRLVGNQYIPSRGDIVIVKQDNLTACGQPQGMQIVKRVIGLPGERVVFKNGIYTVYDTRHPGGFNPDSSLPYGRADTALLSDPSSSTVDATLSSTQLFVSGDHRADSCDSRSFGPIQSSQIIGKVVARIAPLSDTQVF